MRRLLYLRRLEGLERVGVGVFGFLLAWPEGRRVGAEHNAIVQAHFSLGTDQWRVTTTVAEVSDDASGPPLLLAPLGAGGEASRRGLEKWEFASFRELEGGSASPSFVFFPGGSVQGGRLEMGCGTTRAWLELTASGAFEQGFERVGKQAPAWGPQRIDRDD